MSRTTKWEHPSDSWQRIAREERTSRQPQRDKVAFTNDLDLDDDNPEF